MSNLEPIYTELRRHFNGGTMDSVNGKESVMMEWQKLSEDEKMAMLFKVAEEYKLPLKEAITITKINEEEAYVNHLLANTEVVTGLQNECGGCGKTLPWTKVSQFDVPDENGNIVTPDSLPRIMCTDCEA